MARRKVWHLLLQDTPQGADRMCCPRTRLCHHIQHPRLQFPLKRHITHIAQIAHPAHPAHSAHSAHSAHPIPLLCEQLKNRPLFS